MSSEEYTSGSGSYEESDEEEFESKSNEKKVTPIKAGQLKKGMHVVAKDIYPCKIISTSTSKTGKHGHAKIHILCADIFTDKKYEIHEST